MWYKRLKERFHLPWSFDIYKPARPIDDPSAPIVTLRNDIVDLVEGRTLHIIGATETSEAYLFLRSYDRYKLVRTRKGKSREYAVFHHDWPTNPNLVTQPMIVVPEGFEIRGNPYKITKEIDELGRIVLTLEH